MKSKIESGADRRAVVGASADRRRVGASAIGREIEKSDICSGYAVAIGREVIDTSGELVSCYLTPDGDKCWVATEKVLYPTYADACEVLARVLRESVSEDELNAFPPPEFPRVVYVRLSASVMGVA